MADKACMLDRHTHTVFMQVSIYPEKGVVSVCRHYDCVLVSMGSGSELGPEVLGQQVLVVVRVVGAYKELQETGNTKFT